MSTMSGDMACILVFANFFHSKGGSQMCFHDSFHYFPHVAVLVWFVAVFAVAVSVLAVMDVERARKNMYCIDHSCALSVMCLGVSCDSCMKSGFSGLRYKCLVCCDYDLCSACYEARLVTSRHKVDHAMQCLLSKSDVGQSSYLL